MRHLLLLSSLMIVHLAHAQCADCLPDADCTVSPAYPTLCPETPPDATAGQYYEAVATFWMPPSFTDPESGFTVSLQQMTVTGVSGLPFGMDLSFNHPTGVYHPQEEQHGCGRICGTPVAPGTFPVTISVLAEVSLSGIPLSIPQSLTLYLNVLPGSGANAGFTFSPMNGCSPVEVAFQALINGSPSPTAYSWQFGDGTVGTGEEPPLHAYTVPGQYVVTLQTSIGGYVLDHVELSTVNGNWCGDIEEPNIPFLGCQGSPDPYFVLTDGQGYTFTSATVNNTTAASWGDLGVPLNTPPYSIAFMDEDAISADDALGTFNLPAIEAGTIPFNVAAGTTGNLLLQETVQAEFFHVDTVEVFPAPEVVLLLDTVGGALCTADSSLMTYIWFLDGDTVPGLGTPCITPTGPGAWQVQGITELGCAATSNTVIICPTFTITATGPVLQVPSGYASYAWTYQGSAIGGNDPFLVTQGDGAYAVSATASNGCVVNATYELITAGLGENHSTAKGLFVFPSPNNGRFQVVASGLAGSRAEARILDALGRVVQRYGWPVEQGQVQVWVETVLPSGTYLLQLSDARHTRYGRFSVH